MQIDSILVKTLVCVLLFICSLFDIRKKELPLMILIAGFLAALGIEMWCIWKGLETVAGIAESLLPGIFFLLLSFCTREKVGYGDGLLLIILGLFLGFYRCFLVLCFGLIFSSVFALILLLFCKAGKNSRLPLVPFLTIGMGVSFFV
ncbi:MAG: prepilin peptidase [Lachnospiraceae bacterium]|nr:prepilin peptidase [Lachnospiraceae bacterium]